jgi:hypothetical protein
MNHLWHPEIPSFQLSCIEDWDATSVIGKNCGTDLKVGMVFNTAASILIIKEAGDVFGGDYQVADIEVSLEVKEILADEKSLENLSHGMTGKLLLEGTGLIELRKIEESKPEHLFYHLEARARPT